MYFVIYKVTNLITNEIYIGQHQTTDLNDRYLGSGSLLLKSIKKYGRENFKKEILETFDNFEDMDDREIELVDKEFVKRSDTLNVCLGGRGNKERPNFIVVKHKGDDIFYTILKENYDPAIHDTPSTGRISVIDSKGRTKSIKKTSFRKDKHKPVLGGIVAVVDGIKKYVTEQEFKDKKLSGVHKNKITAFDKVLNRRRHVTREEFYSNLDRYQHNTAGYCTGTHKVTNKKKRFRVEDVDANRVNYLFSTTNQRTVFDTTDNTCKNINKDDYDTNIHRCASDKKFIWYDRNDQIICEWFGSKKDFILKYKISNNSWLRLNKGEKITYDKSGLYIGSYAIFEDWKANFKTKKITYERTRIN